MATTKTTITLSTQGAHWLGEFEGFSSQPYLDGGGLLTIGYGHRIANRADYPKGISRDTAATLLQLDVAEVIRGLTDLKLDLPLQHHQDAVISLVYNIGIGAFRKSIIYAALASKSWDLYAWESWTRDAKGVVELGLVKRRAAEMKLFIWALYD
jgi:lysozyme